MSAASLFSDLEDKAQWSSAEPSYWDRFNAALARVAFPRTPQAGGCCFCPKPLNVRHDSFVVIGGMGGPVLHDDCFREVHARRVAKAHELAGRAADRPQITEARP